MSELAADRDPVEALAEEFLERRRRGERPRVEDYAARHPGLADQIRALFPAMLLMEELRPDSDDSLATAEGAPAADGMPEQLGDYRLLREIGRGGMGVVYEAEQESLGRHVAVKVLQTGPLTDRKFLLRFEREARAAARLHHTNIVPVFGVGQQDGLHYYVMQFIHGQGLDAVIAEIERLRAARPAGEPPGTDREGTASNLAAVALSLCVGQEPGGPGGAGTAAPRNGEATDDLSATSEPVPAPTHPLTLPGRAGAWRVYPRSVARIGLQVAEALECAHGQGVLHRDIKPSNLLLDTQGHVWVTDFGLAKASDSADLTGTGDLIGTLRYMAPERFQGRSDARGDVYGLGLTLYELLAGRPAFDETDRNALIHQVTQHHPPRLRALNPAVPRDLATVVEKAMAREPEDRYGSAGELAEDLQRFLDDQPIRARRFSLAERCRRWCRRNPAVAALTFALAAALLLGFAGMTWLWRAASAARDDEVVQRRQADGARRTAEKARALAQEAQQNEAEEARRANALARNNHRQLVAIHVSTGARRWQEDDPFGALLSFAEALRLDEGDAAREAPHRIRLANLIQLMPRLRQLWYVPDGVGAAEFSPDGRCVVAASYLRWSWTSEKPSAAHVWDAHTGQAACPPLRHAGAIRHAAFSPDGLRVVTASDDGTARVWGARTGAPVAGPFRHDSGRVMYAAFSPDGGGLVTAGSDDPARVWDLDRGGAPRFPPLRHDGPVVHAEFSPDGRLLATATNNGTVRLWDAASGRETCRPLARAGARAWFSADGGRLLTAFSEPEVIVWEVAPGGTLKALFKTGAGGGSKYAALSPDGRRVVVCYHDGGAQVWDVRKRQPLTPILARGSWLWHAAFSPDGRYLATAGDRAVRIWEAATGQPAFAPLPHASNVLSVAFHPDGRQLLTASGGGVVRVWDLYSRPRPDVQFRHAAAVRDVAFSARGHLATASADRTARVWDAHTGTPVTRPLRQEHGVNCVAFDADGGRLVSGDAGGNVQVWDARTGKALGPPLTHDGSVRRATFSRDGRLLLVAVAGSRVRPAQTCVWEVPTRRRLVALSHAYHLLLPALSPDGRRLVTIRGEARDAVEVCDAVTGRALLPPLKHRGEVGSVSFSPDGRRLVTACFDTSLNGLYAQVWDADTGRPVGPPLAHFDGVLVAAFSPDGRRVATGGEDKVARVWEADTGRPVTPALMHSGMVREVAFSPGGRYLLTRDAAAYVREADTGHLVAVIPGRAAGGVVGQCVFSPDSRAVVTAGPDGRARLWRLDADKRPVREWLGLARLLAAHRIDAAGGLTPLSGAELNKLWQSLRGVRMPGEPGVDSEAALRRGLAHLEAGRRDAAAAEFAPLYRLPAVERPPWVLAGWWVAGPYAEDLAAEEIPEIRADPARLLDEGAKDGPPRRWRRAFAHPDGGLDLGRYFRRAEHISAYALTLVHSPREQQVTLRAGSDDQLRLWVNGVLVHEHPTPRGARPDEDTVRVTLRPGWNTLVAKVVNVTGSHLLYLRVTY